MRIKYRNIKTGIFTLLPLIIFIAIIIWVIKMILKVSDTFFILAPTQYFKDVDGDLLWYWHIVGVCLLIVIVWVIGRVMNHYYIGKKINKLIQPIIKKTPILNTLMRIGKQINKISQNKSSFKEVVIIQFPIEGVYSIGFITSENIPILQEKIGKKIYSVFIPTTPNPTNGYLCIIPEEKLIKTNISVANGIEYVISMGTLIDLESIQKIEKETAPSE